MNTATNPTETIEQKIARLEAENSALKTKKVVPITMKIGEKGGVSVYGLGRFPTSLYKEQWIRLLDKADDIRAFIAANEKRLATKE